MSLHLEFLFAISGILKGKYVGREKNHPINIQTAFRQLRRMRENFVTEISMEENPITGILEERILVGGKLLLMKNEISRMTQKTLREAKGAGATKLTHRLENKFTGVRYKNVLAALKNIPDSQASKPVFDNKAPMKPVTASFVQQRHQIDLVSFQNMPVVKDGKTYRYVLAVMDIFSRYLWLRPLEGKTSDVIANHLEKIYSSEGPPVMIQCDNGKEFRGAVSMLCKRLGVKIICGRPYHPQSQGKIESSHISWKRKLNFDIRKQTETTWVDSLDLYCRLRNEEVHSSTKYTPFEVYHGRQSNRLKPHFKSSNKNTSSVKTKTKKQYLIDIDIIRKKAKKNSNKAAKYMVRKHLSKHRPSSYNIGENVLVRTSSGKTGKLRSKTVIQGKVIKKNSVTHMFKVALPNQEEKWFRVSDLAALTRQRDLELRSAKEHDQIKILCNCENDLCTKSPDPDCSFSLNKYCCRRKPYGLRCNIPSHNKLNINNFILEKK